MTRITPRHRFLRPGRHRDDRAIVALAVPALGALAADPLYSLADTAFVGNLGTAELGAVAIGTAAFTASFWLFSFLAYGVTPRVARALGAGNRADADRVGVQALLLATGIGVTVSIVGVALAGPIVRLLGASGDVAFHAEPYLRVRILSSTAVLVGQVGHGWLRGAQDTRTPMFVATAGALANVVFDYLLIYPAGMGVVGAAWATVIGQGAVALVFVLILLRRMYAPQWRFEGPAARSLIKVGIDLAIRTGALLAGLTVATSVAARMGQVQVASWQIAMQMFLLLALTLDSVAIAAQALIGRRLGEAGARSSDDLSKRLMSWGIGLGVALTLVLVGITRPVAEIFSNDAQVVTAAAGLLIWLALIQPLAAVAFTLDGILIGASDTRFLAASMAVSSLLFVGICLVALWQGWGTAGLAVGASVWMLVRVITTGARWRGGRWAVAH
jgi:putative MATE family efflux protein